MKRLKKYREKIELIKICGIIVIRKNVEIK